MGELSLKYIEIDSLQGKPVADLKAIAAEAELVRAAVQAELVRQREETDEALRATGYDDQPSTGDKPRRGRRPKAAPNGHDDEPEVQLDAD